METQSGRLQTSFLSTEDLGVPLFEAKQSPMAQTCLVSSGNSPTSFHGVARAKGQALHGTRMRGWGLEQSCVFCGERDESRDHLYFACPYTFTVWMNVAEGLLTRRITPDWEDTISSLLSPNAVDLIPYFSG